MMNLVDTLSVKALVICAHVVDVFGDIGVKQKSSGPVTPVIPEHNHYLTSDGQHYRLANGLYYRVAPSPDLSPNGEE